MALLILTGEIKGANAGATGVTEDGAAWLVQARTTTVLLEARNDLGEGGLVNVKLERDSNLKWVSLQLLVGGQARDIQVGEAIPIAAKGKLEILLQVHVPEGATLPEGGRAFRVRVVQDGESDETGWLSPEIRVRLANEHLQVSLSTTAVELKVDDPKATLTVTLANQGTTPIDGTLKITSPGPFSASLSGSRFRDLAPGGQPQQVTVTLERKPARETATHDAVVAFYSEGPGKPVYKADPGLSVRVHGKAFPWWIIAVAAGIAVVVGIVVAIALKPDKVEWSKDVDNDGFVDDDIRVEAGPNMGPDGHILVTDANKGDCDDDEPKVNPGADVTVCDGFDDSNCDGDEDEAEKDSDGDGASECDSPRDCDDNDSAMTAATCVRPPDEWDAMLWDDGIWQ